MNITKFCDMGKWNIFQQNKKETKKEIRYILSIDGGGMRGIIPAYLINKMDTILGEDFGDDRPFYSHFDLVAGTSTGALIALALTSPIKEGILTKQEGKYPVFEKHIIGRFFKKEEQIYKGDIEPLAASDALLAMYLNRSGDIFKQPHHLKSLFGPVFSDKYDGKSLEEFLTEALGDTRLDECLVPTIAVAYETNTSMPYIFSSRDSHGFLCSEAARASSAAPTYFPASNLIDRETGEVLSLIDGGVVANNPTLLAYKEARKLYPNADEYRILSLSTCAPKHSVDVQSYTQGAIAWASPLYKAYSEGQLAMVDEIVPSIKDLRYTRIWAPVLTKKIKLDDISIEAKEQLLKAAGDTFLAKEDDIMAYLKELSEEPTHNSIKLSNGSNLLDKPEDVKLISSSQDQ